MAYSRVYGEKELLRQTLQGGGKVLSKVTGLLVTG
jgi:hypothetical protein